LFKQSEAVEKGNVGTKEPSAYLTTFQQALRKAPLLVSRLYKGYTESNVIESTYTN
jgi:hypothetical protein